MNIRTGNPTAIAHQTPESSYLSKSQKNSHVKPKVTVAEINSTASSTPNIAETKVAATV
ncbi:MAG: hypothetical protein ACR2F2_02355 [Pyrinomonadaceae bacterium]